MDKFTDAEILESAPTLTFEPFAEEKALPDPEKPEELAEIKKELEEPALTDEEKKMVQEFSEKIDLKNSNQILQYGAGAQKKIADFSQSALDNVRTRDLGEVGDLLAGVVGELKEFDVEEDKGFLGIFKKAGNRLDTLKARYSKAEANVNNMVQVLEGHQIQLMKDTAMLDKMYDINKNYFKELNMYILAGKKKIEQTKNVDLPALMEKAKASGQAEDAQEVNDMKAMVDRFEKKIHDLELTKTISLQMAPQIRMIQHNDVVMAEKIQSTLVNTIAGEELMKTSAIREDDSKGRHTTTYRQLFVLNNGVTIIDTPGMREIGVMGAEEGIEDTFSDIEALKCQCTFSDCEHRTEPGCAIRAALENGSLDTERYQLYLNLQKESSNNAAKMKQIAKWKKQMKKR